MKQAFWEHFQNFIAFLLQAYHHQIKEQKFQSRDATSSDRDKAGLIAAIGIITTAPHPSWTIWRALDR